jgi:hypothetical protein
MVRVMVSGLVSEGLQLVRDRLTTELMERLRSELADWVDSVAARVGLLVNSSELVRAKAAVMARQPVK